jgi:hypothetical protein
MVAAGPLALLEQPTTIATNSPWILEEFTVCCGIRFDRA